MRLVVQKSVKVGYSRLDQCGQDGAVGAVGALVVGGGWFRELCMPESCARAQQTRSHAAPTRGSCGDPRGFTWRYHKSQEVTWRMTLWEVM